MQRVATELHEALSSRTDIQLQSQILYSSWERINRAVPFFLVRSAAKLQRLASEEKIDAVLFSSMVTASLSVIRRRIFEKAGIKTAAIVHGEDVTLPVWIYQKFVPRIFNALDAVMPVSEATGVQCLDRGLSEDKLYVVPNGVKIERFTPPQDRAAMRNALVNAFDGDASPSLSDRALILCSVGRQVKRKGFAWFVANVMPQLPDDVHYWLAGDGPETEAIRAAARNHGVSERVRLLGRVSDEHLALLYRGADLFIMPNIPVPGTMEGFGVVLLEAGINGMPAIASRLEGIQDVIQEGQNGHFVDSGNAEGFRDTILSYFHDRKALEALSDSAYAFTRGTFGWKSVAKRYVNVLKGL